MCTVLLPPGGYPTAANTIYINRVFDLKMEAAALCEPLSCLPNAVLHTLSCLPNGVLHALSCLPNATMHTLSCLPNTAMHKTPQHLLIAISKLLFISHFTGNPFRFEPRYGLLCTQAVRVFCVVTIRFLRADLYIFLCT